jgi:epoxyqueuosine reductase
VVDARRCLAWVVQAPGPVPVDLRAAVGDRIFGCDDCQDVCPVNRLADRRETPPPAGPGAVDHVDLLGLLGATDAELLARHGRWYVADRDPRHLRRNALVALGNVGSPDDPATVAALAHWADGDDDLLAEHARWALDRLAGRRP